MSEPDPLEEREERELEVRDRRLLEEMAQDQEIATLAQLLEIEAVRDYLWEIIKRCNTLAEAWDSNYGKVSYNCGRQSVGRMLIADINLASPQAWRAMQEKAAEIVQKAARAEALKRLRKGRST